MLLHVSSRVSHSPSFLQTSQILEEADAAIVARKWLDNVLEQGVRAKVDHVLKEVEDLGLPPVKNGANFQAALIAEREARLMIVQCGVEIWANVCMFVKCLVIGPRA